MRRDWVIEKVKTLIIVVLFLTAILLLYFFWKGFSFDELRLELPQVSSENVLRLSPEELVAPKDVQVTFGPDNYSLYTSNTGELWKSFLLDLASFSKSENIFVEEISLSQWIESMQLKSIRYTFSYPLPTSYLESLGVAGFSQASGLEAFTTIGYSVASRESIFLSDRQTGKYYRMVSDRDYTSQDNQITSLETQPRSLCYPISMFYGAANATLLPYDLQSQLQPLAVHQEPAEDLEEYQQRIAEEFFGENLDFIRKITGENNQVVYMYGVGERVLSLDPSGRLEYSQQPGNSGSALSFYDALVLASDFVATHGNWLSFQKEPMDAYLIQAQALEENGRKNGYRFFFGDKANGYPLYSQQGAQILVEVTGNQVTRYERNTLSILQTLTSPEPAGTAQACPIIEILPADYHILAQILRQLGQEVSGETPDDQFNAVLQQISSVSLGYFEQINGETGAVYYTPCWVIRLSGANVFFDLYNGAYLGYLSETVR